MEETDSFLITIEKLGKLTRIVNNSDCALILERIPKYRIFKRRQFPFYLIEPGKFHVVEWELDLKNTYFRLEPKEDK